VLRSLFRTKDLDTILAAAEAPHSAMKRTLGPVSITLLGIGAIIGTGIYATIGTATAGDPMRPGVAAELLRPGAGPSLMLSFLITAVVCGFTALCYAEIASMVPISGSAYTYTYATLGELIAWIIGWDLIIEYGIGNVSVSIAWAGYFRSFVHDLASLVAGHPVEVIPAWLATDFRSAARLAAADPEAYRAAFGGAPHIYGQPIVFNVLAFGITMLVTGLLVWGIRESARFNAVMVVLKVAVLVFFVAVGLSYLTPAKVADNWTPFTPNGWRGTFAGAAVVFFAYIGFDALSTVAEETRNPGRDLPIGILASLAICTVFYVIIAAVFTGMVPYPVVRDWTESERAESLTMALRHVAPGATVARMVVGFGSIVAQTAVLLVFLMGQPRIFFSMARDGLLPPAFARLHPRFRTPYVTTILTGVVVAVLSGVASIDEIVDLTNIGTLFAFVLVCIGIPILRFQDPTRRRPFRVPLGPFVFPVLGAGSCLFLMYYLPPSSWWRFVGWLVLGLAVYAWYGYAHSHVGREAGRPSRTPPGLQVAALGFVIVTVGLFTIPHQAGPIQLVQALFDAGAAEHGRTLAGVVMIVVGLAMGIGGWLRGTAQRGPRPA
jgi:APA family basic amino acid/polyamine antiporter